MAEKEKNGAPGNGAEIIANVSPRSIGNTSLFEFTDTITPNNVDQFRSDEATRTQAVRALKDAGFRILHVGDITLSISGPRELYEKVFGAKLKEEKKEIVPDQETASFYKMEEVDDAEAFIRPSDALGESIEGLSFAEPPEYFAASPLPPLAEPAAGAYRYLLPPDEIAVITNAARIHRLGSTGRGVKVAMVDSGHFKHPFFNRHGYRVKSVVLGPGATNPSDDLSGHGTGESANVFATAPDVDLIPVKMAIDATGAFSAAVAQGPDVITCSWGYNIDRPGQRLPSSLRPLEAEVASAVASGIVVCFSAGNGHYGWPGSHPDVISVGGVHVNYPSLELEASSYASSFDSTFYSGRSVPDICGLVGRNVSGTAPLIMLPVQPGSNLDLSNTGSTSDGWGIFSGTSAACPQVAGIVALLLEKDDTLTPAQVKDILKRSAIDVRTGTSAHGDTATTGPDAATGAGLANAKWAWLITMGSVTAQFFNAPQDAQVQMLSEGRMPSVTNGLIDEMIETLRSSS